MFHAFYTNKVFLFQQEQTFVGTYKLRTVQIGNAQHFAHQSLIRSETRESGGHSHTEYAILGGTPKLPVTIIANVNYVVGTDSIFFRNSIQQLAFIVSNINAASSSDNGSQAVA